MVAQLPDGRSQAVSASPSSISALSSTSAGVLSPSVFRASGSSCSPGRDTGVLVPTATAGPGLCRLPTGAAILADSIRPDREPLPDLVPRSIHELRRQFIDERT